MMIIAYIYLFMLISLWSPFLGKSEIFTSTYQLRNLIENQEFIINSLNNYLDTERARLDELEKIKNDLGRLRRVSEPDPENFIANPVNVYSLINKITTDWEIILELLGDDKRSLELIENMNFTLPTRDDTSMAKISLLRLQILYKLDTSMLANGELEGTTIKIKLTANECFDLGLKALGDYDAVSESWIREALDRFDPSLDTLEDKIDMLYYYSFVLYKNGKYSLSLEAIEELLKYDPEHILGKLHKINIDKKFVKNTGKLADISSLCMGEKPQNAPDEKKLFCRYKLNGDPYFLIQPIQEEVISESPKIVILHNIISDNEIETILNISQPRLKRAMVINKTSGAQEPSPNRITQNVFLAQDEHNIIARLNKRISIMTGLSMTTAEKTQIANYGVGGFYNLHYDYATGNIAPNATSELLGNDRIATVLIYLNDVTAGGATIFPYAGVTVWPKKGSAAFWYNLKKNELGDNRTQHAACPVLVGTKWIANKWIRVRGQEFNRPCGLDKNEYNTD